MREVTAAHEKVEMLVRAQTRMLDFFDSYDVSQLYDEEYFRLYLYGAYDAAIMAYGPTIRSKIGLPLIRVGLTKYLAEELTDGDREDAERGADAIVQECLGLPDLATNRAVLEGGAEGLGIIGGKNVSDGRLLRRFGGEHEPAGQRQVDGFVAFVAKDETRLRALRAR
ncbi:hypothetical protein ASF22_22450 [Methylobacterium sp. Leaf87]|uniref:hypothetical protein n=1 Tax=Methylobacterium sp. Leaf87 TaxID=1736243 RepID=UPI0007004A61|nr:hypothetical protein [Methylobacterium sp. Leaf87]KQO60176.1 hypothetical protein ASF22_22450 [Methylobacterium sp. Leaf87]